TPSAYRTANTGGYDVFVTRLRFFTRFDFNGDGLTDLLMQQDSTGNIGLWTMNGLTRLNALSVYRGLDPAWKVVAVNDFNGDGQNDLIMQNQSTGHVVCWFMNGLQRLNSVYITKNLPLA